MSGEVSRPNPKSEKLTIEVTEYIAKIWREIGKELASTRASTIEYPVALRGLI